MHSFFVPFLLGLAYGAHMRASPKAAATVNSINSSLSANKTIDGKNFTVTKNAPFYMLLLKEWKEVPELGPFTERCVPLIEKLLPRLGNEYTKLQVPKVLLHECDVYATKTDYQVDGSSLETARGTCRISARELGEEYMGDKDYKAWCGNLHAYLTDQFNFQKHLANRDQLTAEADRIRDELAELRKQYEKVKAQKGCADDGASKDCSKDALPCCPSTCRPC